MLRKLAAVLTATAAVALGSVVTAPAASAEDFHYTWGDRTEYIYQYGNRVHGEVRAETWVDDWEKDVDGDGFPDEEYIRGHARICKVSKASRVQVDLVRLGNYTYGGVLKENATPKNSGTANCVDSVTAWVPVTWSYDCAEAFEAITRGSFSIRWSNTGRLSKVSFLSYPTEWDWCRAGAATAQKDQ
jgi:hypothetical protein